jgi:dipeptide/tripeptide permease
MQNMGVIFASFTVGSFVSNQPIQYLFYLAAIGLIITLLIFYWVFGQASKNNDNSQIQPSRYH